MKKVAALFLLMVLMDVGIRTLTFGQINPGCPNGCLDKLGQCYCYGTHAFKEASWIK